MRNGAGTILGTLESVLGQTVPPRRIIVVDDGSTDGGAELLVRHPQVEVIATPPLGVSHARNMGIRAARAEFVAFLDADDLWRKDKLEKQLAVARARPDAAIVTCDHVSVTTGGAIIPQTELRLRFDGHVFDDVLAQGLELRGLSSSLLVRRAAFDRTGLYDEQLAFGEDLDLSLRLARDHALAACPEVLVFVVENPASATRRVVDAASAIEVCMQCYCVAEKWLAHPGGARLARQCTRRVLAQLVLRRFRIADVRTIRLQMAARTPGLARRIARSDLHLAFSLVAAGVLDFGRVLAALRRHLARRRQRARLAAPAPRANLEPGRAIAILEPGRTQWRPESKSHTS